jgi:hypothetical protein
MTDEPTVEEIAADCRDSADPAVVHDLVEFVGEFLQKQGKKNSNIYMTLVEILVRMSLRSPDAIMAVDAVALNAKRLIKRQQIPRPIQ